jgi:hypothetical protein
MLDRVPPGLLVDTQWLKGQGVDAKSIHNYVALGWLERVVWGVYPGAPQSPAVQGGDIRRLL